MSNTAIRYLTMLRMVPRYPRTITTTELSKRLEERGYSIAIRTIQRDLEKLSVEFPLIVDESSRPHQWSFDRETTMDIIPALDLPAALTFELAQAYLKPLDQGGTCLRGLPQTIRSRQASANISNNKIPPFRQPK